MLRRPSTLWRALGVALLGLAPATWPTAPAAAAAPLVRVLHQDAVVVLHGSTAQVGLSLLAPSSTHLRIALYPRIIDRGQIDPLLHNNSDARGAIATTAALALTCEHRGVATVGLTLTTGSTSATTCGRQRFTLHLPCVATSCDGVYPLRLLYQVNGRTYHTWSMVAVQASRVRTPLHLAIVLSAGPGAWTHRALATATLLALYHFPNVPLSVAAEASPLTSAIGATTRAALAWRNAFAVAMRDPQHQAIVATPAMVDLGGLAVHGFTSLVEDDVNITSSLIQQVGGRFPDGPIMVTGHAATAGLVALARASNEFVVRDTSLNPAPSTTLTWGAPFHVADVGGALALATDAPLTSLAGDTSIEPGRRAAMTQASLAFLHFEAPEATGVRTVVLEVPLASAGPAYLRDLLSGLRANPFVTAVSLARGFSPSLLGSEGAPTSRFLGPPPHSDWSPSNVTTLANLAAQTDAFTHGVQSLAERDRLKVALLNAPVTGSASNREDSELNALEALQAQFGLFHIDDSSLTLTGSGTDLPITILKNTRYPMKVVIRLVTTDLSFPHGNTIETILRSPTTSLRVPIAHARGTDLTLQIRLTTPDSSITLNQTAVQVRIAGTSVVGYLLSFFSLAVLAAWWWRTNRRGRRSTR